jgi:hypothetical protein
MNIERTHFTTAEKQQMLIEGRRKRAALVQVIRAAYARGDIAEAEENMAAVRRTDAAFIGSLKNDPGFAPNGPESLWDFKPIDEEDFMGKNHTTQRTESKTMSTEDKKIEILTEMAKLPPEELAKLRVLAEHIQEFAKLTPQERARVLAKAERAGALVLAKAQSSSRSNPR